MTPPAETRGWADAGFRLLLDGVDGLSDAELDAPCGLTGWNRRHLLAHVASNAEAIGRLLDWARTGVESRMYASPDQRAADITAGATRPDLRQWLRDSATTLARAMDDLPEEAWGHEVVTAQGRVVQATETTWMRARETCIHAVDLGTGTTFDDLSEGFLTALVADVAAWRADRPGPAFTLTTPRTRHEFGDDPPPTRLDLPLATAAAWLTGRHGADLPALPGWL
ncbi:maleylpyruvate isomerase family mycothiol-dependent enzyme [Pseudonocardia kujensis]|uniref:maleylpyruvate isomerase family mycothiol-dependent enzyme n=1 Tax=Pseudonocardia kujensis TaxID=1128675 RepID=UPI001E28D956|nr:maleylpyruvate isomerase family mycothiol-dependent enzyme [Pseudonocardia kujensis]MCE0767295.1 maleylpyruvate isomerase family mycothiol-dependent enzyme [Pseudonocardia kujensis]